MTTRDLLLEIGGEEIPARMLQRAIAELPALAKARFDGERLAARTITAVGTPRRLTLLVHGLSERQPDLTEQVVGPPASAAFDASGALTKAGLGFAAKNGVAPEALSKAEVPGKKGQYLVATRHVVGRPTREVLPELLAGLIASVPWPKGMRWGWGETAYVRPVHWLVALWGAEVIPVRFAGVAADRASYGHRFLAPERIELADAASYLDALRAAFVVVEPAERKRLIVAEIARIERDTRCTAIGDADLLDEVTNLCEYPVGISGGFDPSYLEVPEEVLITAMRNHQRYFAMRDGDGRLAPRFVTIAATVTRDAAVVAGGNQRVLAARLADAQFFFAEDRKKSLDELRRKLDDVVFQAKLGAGRSIGDKVRRIVGIVDQLATRLRLDAAVAHRAAELCKSDLLTGVVGEFPELQGVMGGHYARMALAESPATAAIAARVGQAVVEHYMPRGSGAALPDSLEGAAIAIADRIDTLVGCFGTGLEPTGSADPFGLRRAANGILAINLDLGPGGARHATLGKAGGWPLPLEALVDLAVAQFAGAVAITAAHRDKLLEFLAGRLRTLLIDEGLASTDIDAAIAIRDPQRGFDVCDIRLRARALAVVPAAAREVFKRIANILDDARAQGIALSGEVKPALFVAEGNAEWKLWKAFGAVAARLETAVAAQAYRDMLEILVELQPVVAGFFDKGGVMVMDPDPDKRENRLSLLASLLAPFARVADFRLAAGGGS